MGKKEEKTNFIACPFCKEDDFDLVGLKCHLLNHCIEYNETKTFYSPTVFQDLNKKEGKMTNNKCDGCGGNDADKERCNSCEMTNKELFVKVKIVISACIYSVVDRYGEKALSEEVLNRLANNWTDKILELGLVERSKLNDEIDDKKLSDILLEWYRSKGTMEELHRKITNGDIFKTERKVTSGKVQSGGQAKEGLENPKDETSRNGSGQAAGMGKQPQG